MFLVKQCTICNRRFNAITNDSYAKLYNDAMINLHASEAVKHLRETGQLRYVDEDDFVCRECARKAATVVCACCHKEHAFIVHDAFLFASIDSFASTAYEYSKKQVKDLEATMTRQTHGRKPFQYAGAQFICESCVSSMIKDAVETGMEELERRYGQGLSQPILLFNDVPNDKSRCLRCGSSVSDETNHAALLRCSYSDAGYPFHDYKDECKSVITKYLNAKAICPECCWQLRPAHVRDDYMFRAHDGWMGETQASSFGEDYIEMHRFDLISDKIESLERRRYGNGEYSESETDFRDRCMRDFKTILKARALQVGANGFVGFSFSISEKYGPYYSGEFSAIPVMIVRKSNTQDADMTKLDKATEVSAGSVALPKSIIIDGSNMIRFKDGGSVKGLTTSISALKDRGCHVRVFLDANILHVLEDNGDVDGKALLEKLLSESSDTIKMVPAGSVADEFILLCANRDGSHVLSNDRYEPYVERYPWLKNKRTHKFMFMDGRLMIPDFGIDVEVK